MTPISRAIIATIVMSLPSLALAQGAPGAPEAPVGHRQPNASEVPPDDSVKGEKAAVGKVRGRAAGSVPNLDVRATCRRAQPISAGGEQSARDSCLRDEMAAQKELVTKWSTFKSSAQSVCLQETKIGGAPSYVELITCLELDKQAAEAAIENRKALKAPKSQ
jgi:hypothetical protein